jgi:hypothetical protein
VYCFSPNNKLHVGVINWVDYGCVRDFPIRLENPHVIGPNQIWAGVVPVGPSGRTFNSSYRTRDTMEYKQELGNAIGMWQSHVYAGFVIMKPCALSHHSETAYLVKNVGVALCLIVEILLVSGLEHCILDAVRSWFYILAF